jgi:outer membrane biosynthesis protein TonB
LTSQIAGITFGGPTRQTKEGEALAIWLALVVLAAFAAPATAADPQPDAAPQAPAVAPDPAPGGAQQPPSTTTTPVPPEQPSANPPASPPTTSQPSAPAAAQQPSATGPKEQPREQAHKHRHAPVKAHRAASHEAGATRASSMVRVRPLFPIEQTADDSSSKLLMLAGGALLALVLASGSMVSVSSRAMKGQLR